MSLRDPTGIDALNAICEAFGLPLNVRSLTIRLDVGAVPIIEVTQIVDAKSLGVAATILTETFELRRRPERDAT